MQKSAQKSLAAKKFSVKRGVNGLGLFTNVAWKRREKLIEYVGERITPEEADRRGGKYLFEVNKKLTVDGKSRSNLARYINHSCAPNCETEIDEDEDRIYVYSIKKIEPGEELTYDYGKEYFDEYIKPKGCRCPKCLAKKKPESKTKAKVAKKAKSSS